jgi:hypothetical protein
VTSAFAVAIAAPDGAFKGTSAGSIGICGVMGFCPEQVAAFPERMAMVKAMG